MSKIIKILKPVTLRDGETGELYSPYCGQILSVSDEMGAKLIADGLGALEDPVTPTGTKSISANGTYDVSLYASANVLIGLNTKTVGLSGDVDLLGKTADDLQEDVEVANGAITGTLKYVTGYTGFSGDVAEQSGNYLALKVTAIDGATITVELINGTVGHPVELDEDGMIVVRIANKSTQSVEVIATKDSLSEVQRFSLTGLTLTPQG